jgi:flagellar basal body-associated protein FliL
MTGKPGLDKILSLLNVVVMLGSVGVVYYANFKLKPPPINPAEEFAKLQASAVGQTEAPAFTLPKLVINLANFQGKLHYVDMEVSLEPFQADNKTTFEQNQARITDIIIDVGTNLTLDDVTSLSGKILYAEEIKNRINREFKSPVVKKVLFSRFVVQ